MTKFWPVSVMVAGACLSACGGAEIVDTSCDEPQRYQSVVAGKRIEPPDGLDPLNEYAEMPVPKAEDAPSREPGSRCIELPPSIRSSE